MVLARRRCEARPSGFGRVRKAETPTATTAAKKYNLGIVTPQQWQSLTQRLSRATGASTLEVEKTSSSPYLAFAAIKPTASQDLVAGVPARSGVESSNVGYARQYALARVPRVLIYAGNAPRCWHHAQINVDSCRVGPDRRADACTHCGLVGAEVRPDWSPATELRG